MALLNILVYPDSRLRTVAKPVEAVDHSVATLGFQPVFPVDPVFDEVSVVEFALQYHPCPSEE